VPELALGPPTDSGEKPKRKHVATKPQLLTRDQLDGRTNAAKTFDRLVSSIEADLGGRSELSQIELGLIEAFASSYVSLENINTRLLLGQQIDLAEHAQAVSSLVRVASRLGIRRRAKDVSPPTLSDILRADEQKDDAA
jgi:hypothetical protein